MYEAGDILFYARVDGNLEDMIISRWTDSPFVHVAIAVSPVQKIEALCGGVALTLINSRHVAARYCYQEQAHPLVIEDLDSALAWLRTQIGMPYGVGDIINAFWFRWEKGLSFDVGGHFDCSALACEFLLKAGGIAALEAVTDAHTITPAQLAILLGISSGLAEGQKTGYNRGNEKK